jgi:hypothetical protein
MDRFANDKLAALKARIELLFAKAAAGSKSGPSRYPAGTPKGGQFMPKGGAAGGGDGKMTLRSEPAPSNTKMTSAFAAARVETSNVNAKSHNGRVDAIEKAYAAGDQKSILGMSFGTNTYAKRQCKLANQALEAMGSEHRVAPGQKANSHAGISGPTKPSASPTPTPPAAAAPPAAEPAPKPKGGSSYKQAKTIDDAAAQLKALGVKDVVKVSETEQADWMKQKIANAPPEKKAFYEKYYGPQPTKHRMSDSSFLKVLNAIGPEIARLNDEFPGFMASAVIVQKSTGSKALGTYSRSGASIRMATVETQEKAAKNSIKYQQGSPEKVITSAVTGAALGVVPAKPAQKVPWTVRTDDSVTIATADTFRHEAAHALDYRTGASMSGGAITARLATAMGGSKGLMKYVGENVSRYGGTKPQEATAELITFYTSKNYKRGTLPKEIESVLDAEFQKLRSTLKKVLMGIMKAGVDYLNDDDIIVDIPEPPPGYELIKQEGMDIQFRAPDGGIVSFWDLVEVGYYGFDDEE